MRIKELIYYPIKSCKGVSVDSTFVDHRGLENDRRLMIIGGNGDSITQRENPSLALIEPIVRGTDSLDLTAPGMAKVHVELANEGPAAIAKVWQQPYQAVDQGEEVAQWLTAYLKCPARLVRIGKLFERVTPFAAHKIAHVSFADHFPVVITTQESLDYLNSNLDTPVEMSRYRPNIVIEGCSLSEEYSWSHVIIDQVELEITRVCDRCSVTTIDQSTARASGEALKVLSKLRIGAVSNPVFGLHAAPAKLGRINLKSLASAIRKESATIRWAR